jgi:hypothetical protein
MKRCHRMTSSRFRQRLGYRRDWPVTIQLEFATLRVREAKPDEEDKWPGKFR